LGRAARTNGKDEKMAYPTFVIPVKTGNPVGPCHIYRCKKLDPGSRSG
jgi:hypothetical protein